MHPSPSIFGHCRLNPLPPPPVHNGGPCVWDVYGVARPGSGQCPLPAALSGLCSTGSQGHRTDPSLPCPVMDPPFSFQPPFLFFGFGIAAQQERAVLLRPPVRLYGKLILSSSPFVPRRQNPLLPPHFPSKCSCSSYAISSMFC